MKKLDRQRRGKSPGIVLPTAGQIRVVDQGRAQALATAQHIRVELAHQLECLRSLLHRRIALATQELVQVAIEPPPKLRQTALEGLDSGLVPRRARHGIVGI